MKKKKNLNAKRNLNRPNLLPGFSCVLALAVLADGANAAAPSIDRINPLSTTPNQGFAAQATRNNTVDKRAQDIAEKLPQLLDVKARNNNVLTQLTPRQRKAAAVLTEQAGGTNLRIRTRHGLGTIRYLKVADTGKRLKQATSRLPAGEERDKQTAADFLKENRELLNIAEPAQEFVLERQDKDNTGRARLRYQQRFQNIPIWPAEAQVHLDQNGNVELFEGSYIPTPGRVSLKPKINANEAKKKAQQAVANAKATGVGEAELIIYALDNSAPRLAWKLKVEVSDSQRWLVVVDALDGSIITSFNEVPNNNVNGSGTDLLGVKRTLNVWQEQQGYFMIDTSKKMFDPATNPLDLNSLHGGIGVFDANHTTGQDGSLKIKSVVSTNPKSWSLKDAVSASYGLSKTYDYYLSQHQRNSLDGEGGNLFGVVRYDQDYLNAFWNGTFMAFGDGLPFAGAIDVVGHELTHGVTQSTANLVYKNQSGALNESISDIFGQSVQNFSENKIEWTISEALGDQRFFRDMQNPAKYMNPITNKPYPTKMSEFFNTDQDNGGVHINSNIVNHAFYMLAAGLNNAIGNKDAEKIFYRALTKHLVANSQFIDARLACIQSAEELFGANSPQAVATAKAFDAVEIFDDSNTPGDPSSRPPVTGKDATLFVYDYDGQYYLGRREGSDPSTGIALSAIPVIPKRPGISGDGSTAIFVSADNDLCIVATDGSEPAQCLGYTGYVHSVAMTPDTNRWAFVLNDDTGNPTNEITVIDLDQENSRRTYTLAAPANDSGSYPIAYADSMDFSGDGKTLVYDALAYINQAGYGQTPVWAMYALDLQNEIFTSVLPPTVGVIVGNPSFSQTSDSILAFEASNEQTGETAVFSGNLLSGKTSIVGKSAQCCSLPGFNGDDSAIVYSRYDSSQSIGFSVMRQAMSDDWLTPVGNPTLWLANSYAGSIYRRGNFNTPTAKVVVKPNTLAFGTAGGFKSKVTVVNNGSAAMTLGDVALTQAQSQFSISQDGCTGINLVPSGKCSIEVAFAGGSGLLSGSLKIPQVETGKKLAVSLSGGIKMQVAKATLNFDPTATNKDQFTVSGQLLGASKVSPTAIKSITFRLGGFKQVLNSFTKTTSSVTFQSTNAGIKNLAVDLVHGTFSITGGNITLGKLANPLQVSLMLNSTQDCTRPKFVTQTTQWTFDKAAGQTQKSCTVLTK